jgi:hypothetical protein
MASTTCGNADFRRCHVCKQYDDEKNLYVSPTGDKIFHRECRNKLNRNIAKLKLFIKTKDLQGDAK